MSGSGVLRRSPRGQPPAPSSETELDQLTLDQLRAAAATCGAEIRGLREALTRAQTRHQLLQAELTRRHRRGSFEARFLVVARKKLEPGLFKELSREAREVPPC